MDPIRILDSCFVGSVVAHGRFNPPVPNHDGDLLNLHVAIHQPCDHCAAQSMRMDMINTGGSRDLIKNPPNATRMKPFVLAVDEKGFIIVCALCEIFTQS